jgi:hypothetical protein
LNPLQQIINHRHSKENQKGGLVIRLFGFVWDAIPHHELGYY